MGKKLKKSLDIEKGAPCVDCGKLFSTKHHLEEHRKVKHEDKPFKCEECDKNLQSRKGLQIHIKTHSHDLLKCAKCKAKFAFASDLKKTLEINS
ncbi:unnamed protein product [Heterobilharzia americana]|nr:unnamed protein product [Heterobilharzia americana]